ncbi:hypothetical protein PV326_013278 [Microctonus aethiopoides]|nr:hypothetical protein PV326_013278 [Microctonus aethiopoides]
MHHLKTMAKLMPEEVEQRLALKRERVKECRMKRKLEQKSDSVSKIPRTKTVDHESSQVEELNTMIQKDATVSKHPTPAENINKTPPEAVSQMPPMRDNVLMSNNSHYPHYHGSPFGFHDRPASFHEPMYQNNYQHQPLLYYQPPPSAPSFSHPSKAKTDHPHYTNL